MPFSTETDPSPRELSVVLGLIVPAATGGIATRTLDAGIVGESEGTTALGGALGHGLRHLASDTPLFRQVGWRTGHARLRGGWPVRASAVGGHGSARKHRVENLVPRVEHPASVPASEQPETW